MQDYLEGNFTLHYCAHNIKQLKYNNLREIAFLSVLMWGNRAY